MIIYTDGATSFNGAPDAVGGWAYVLIDENDNIVEEDSGFLLNTTNNICEMTAILEACKAAEKYDEMHTIYSDSSYCVNCYKEQWYKRWLTKGWITSSYKPVLNKDLWEKLIPYFENELFDFMKVKGHSIDKWNNYVDKKAVEEKNNAKRSNSSVSCARDLTKNA